MKPTIKHGEWKDMLANLPIGRILLQGRYYKMDEASMVRQCFDLSTAAIPTQEAGRPSLSDPLMSVAARKSITNRKWYERDKQAKRILRESQQTS